MKELEKEQYTRGKEKPDSVRSQKPGRVHFSKREWPVVAVVAVGSDKDTQHVSCGCFAGMLVQNPDGSKWAEELEEGRSGDAECRQALKGRRGTGWCWGRPALRGCLFLFLSSSFSHSTLRS